MRHHKSPSLPKKFRGTFLFIFLALVVLWVHPNSAIAAEIKMVKAKAVVIEGLDASPGDKYYAYDSQGKRRALIEITKSKNGKSAGRVKKGKAKIGMTVEPRGSQPSESSTESQFNDGESGSHSKLHVGGMLGFGMDAITVSFSDEAVATAGSGFSAKAVADYRYSGLLGLRALVGYETVNATGNSTRNHCNGTSSCTTTISYLTLDAIAQFHLLKGTFGVWVGGGFGFAFPLSKSTNILLADSITTANVLYGALGSDLKLGRTWYMPIQVDYGLFMPQTEVKTSWIAVRVGAMFPF